MEKYTGNKNKKLKVIIFYFHLVLASESNVYISLEIKDLKLSIDRDILIYFILM